MNDPLLSKPLRGIIPPLLTPLSGRDQLDVAGLERLIEHVLAGGVHGLFILGTTGEGPSLSHGLQHDLIERVCRQVALGRRYRSGSRIHRSSNRFAFRNTPRTPAPRPWSSHRPITFQSGKPICGNTFASWRKRYRCRSSFITCRAIPRWRSSWTRCGPALESPNVIGLKDSDGNLIYFHQALPSSKLPGPTGHC